MIKRIVSVILVIMMAAVLIPAAVAEEVAEEPEGVERLELVDGVNGGEGGLGSCLAHGCCPCVVSANLPNSLPQSPCQRENGGGNIRFRPRFAQISSSRSILA